MIYLIRRACIPICTIHSLHNHSKVHAHDRHHTRRDYGVTLIKARRRVTRGLRGRRKRGVPPRFPRRPGDAAPSPQRTGHFATHELPLLVGWACVTLSYAWYVGVITVIRHYACYGAPACGTRNTVDQEGAHTDTQTDKQRYGQTGAQADRQAGRQVGR